MQSFLRTVLEQLKNKALKLDSLLFILPNKRAGLHLKHQLSHLIEQPSFAPQYISIEEFVQNLSGLTKLSNTELLFKFYDIYTALTPKDEQETFNSFISWAQILLQDFNEIDRFLVNQDQIFDYLNAIKELNHWSLEKNQTEFIKNHLKFWRKIKTYYKEFQHRLILEKQGYQGLIYRQAVENLEYYCNENKQTHIFVGFNALNTSESIIFQELSKNGIAEIFWDIDHHFLNAPIHGASHFIKQYKAKWNLYENAPLNYISNTYSEKKDINVIGIPKQINQAKYVGSILDEISKHNKSLSNVAIVLGEEQLLTPILASIPEHITAINVTMGLSLSTIPLALLFDQLFRLHKKSTNTFYYKDVLNIIGHPSLLQLSNLNEKEHYIKFCEDLNQSNVAYLKLEDFPTYLDKDLTKLLFSDWNNDVTIALRSCKTLIQLMKAQLNIKKKQNSLELEYLYRFHNLFNELETLNSKHGRIQDITTLYRIYKELLSSETLDFQGEPLEGLQIMGMLESRALDFETLIITGVNEGILPAGKTQNSFIPFDVKIEHNLPTYKEKDAIYTYHFFRLLQRAKTVYILYNTEIDTLKGGEKSRFITQLVFEGIHQITHRIASPKTDVIAKKTITIKKTDAVISQIENIAALGFSPSSLTNYMRNPLDFYYEKILGVKAFEHIEEHIALNTLGSVIHNTLEDFYKPLEGQLLTLDYLNSLKEKIDDAVTTHFKKLYHKGNFKQGKNLIIFEIAKRYISNFINKEINDLKQGHIIKIIAIEAEETIDMPIDDVSFPVKLTGKVDRIDSFNGTTRIIDYKSGKVEQSKVEVLDWEDITTNYEKYSKSFQVLCYAYIMTKKQRISLPLEAGVISFKNLNSGFIKFSKKESPRGKKDYTITEDILIEFEIELKKLITEICDSNIDFIQKELN